MAPKSFIFSSTIQCRSRSSWSRSGWQTARKTFQDIWRSRLYLERGLSERMFERTDRMCPLLWKMIRELPVNLSDMYERDLIWYVRNVIWYMWNVIWYQRNLSIIMAALQFFVSLLSLKEMVDCCHSPLFSRVVIEVDHRLGGAAILVSHGEWKLGRVKPPILYSPQFLLAMRSQDDGPSNYGKIGDCEQSSKEIEVITLKSTSKYINLRTQLSVFGVKAVKLWQKSQPILTSPTFMFLSKLKWQHWEMSHQNESLIMCTYFKAIFLFE